MFGESPPASASAKPTSKSLFGDEPASSNRDSTASLFADNNTDDSPWSLPTPKKNNRQNFVKNLLPAAAVPDSYIDAYDSILSAGEGHGSGVSLAAARKLLQSSKLGASEQDRILNIVLPAGQSSTSSLERGEFNVLLALVGLAQEDEDISLDSVDDRRKSVYISN